MSESTKIEWCDSTFNPWRGCQHAGPGCDHCYAEALSKRTGGPKYLPGEPRLRTSDANWKLPVSWNRRPFLACSACGWRGERPTKHCAAHGMTLRCPSCEHRPLADARRRVFCASLADVFDNEVDPAWRADLFALIESTPDLDWLVLTKRIGNAARMIAEAITPLLNGPGCPVWPWQNVWLGATVVNQAEANRDVPKLLEIPAAVRFLSIEPMLGPIDLHDHLIRQVNGFAPSIRWVIAGGESGPQARPAHPDWFRSLRDQCATAGVPFLFKQHGEHAPGHGTAKGYVYLDQGQTIRCGDKHTHEWGDGVVSQRIGKKAAGRLLDGVEHNGFPEVRHA